MKLLIVLGEGGHTTEMLNLVDLLGNKYNYYYIVSKEDNLSTDRIKIKGKIFRLNRPRGKKTNIFSSFYNTIMVGIKSIAILKHIMPTAIISTGPAIIVPVAIIGKFLNVKVIFIETGSRVNTASLTGKIMYHFADLFFIQWPILKHKFPKAIYAGRLM
jgi:UDP-N-acetylglucosamine:LPS N-acetylglucosamine transferase